MPIYGTIACQKHKTASIKLESVQNGANFNETALNATTALKCNKQKKGTKKMCSEHQIKSQ